MLGLGFFEVAFQQCPQIFPSEDGNFLRKFSETSSTEMLYRWLVLGRTQMEQLIKTRPRYSLTAVHVCRDCFCTFRQLFLAFPHFSTFFKKKIGKVQENVGKRSPRKEIASNIKSGQRLAQSSSVVSVLFFPRQRQHFS